jgi:hypothetical protein
MQGQNLLEFDHKQASTKRDVERYAGVIVHSLMWKIQEKLYTRIC